MERSPLAMKKWDKNMETYREEKLMKSRNENASESHVNSANNSGCGNAFSMGKVQDTADFDGDAFDSSVNEQNSSQSVTVPTPRISSLN